MSRQSLLLANAQFGPRGKLGYLLIRDGRIAEISQDPPADPAAEVVDLRGRTILPGFFDAHVHIVQWASARRRVDLSKAGSAREAAAAMAAAAQADGRPATAPVIGYGFRDALWADRLEPSLLAWAADTAIVLVSNDLHSAWLSRPALHQIGRGDHPTGVLREHECLDAVARLTRATPETVDQWVADAVLAAAARGITELLDFEYADNITDWTRRAAVPVSARVICAIYPEFLDQAIQRRLRTGDRLTEHVHVGPLKLFVDGSLNTRTALCYDPYPDRPAGEEHGLLETSPAELQRLMSRAARHGIQSAVHAIGDRATAIALDAFDSVRCGGRIEHAQLIARADLPRIHRTRAVLGIQPAHATADRDVADRYWAGRTGRAFAYADLLRAGATLHIGSDAPVSPMDPWLGISAAVYRSADSRPPWHPEQSIGLDDALAAASHGRRRLTKGDRADLVIVECDPSTLPAHDLRNMPVFATMLEGRWTYRAD